MTETSLSSSPDAPAASQAVSDFPLEPRHLPQALAQSQAINWPYRLEDWEFALALGRGFGVAMGDTLVGTALWWPYGEDYASAGMIIVADQAQRKGIGARMMDAMLADAAGRTMILNSTLEGEKLYTRLGFVPYDVVTQHQAVLTQAPARDDTVPLRPAAAADRDAIVSLDRAAAGMDRTALIDALDAIADVLVVERDGAVSGYACVRRWGRGFVIGPVVARDSTDARALIAAHAAAHVGDFVRIDVTRSCGLAPWLVGIGLPQVSEVVSMARGTPPPTSAEATLYALSNQSLG